jgi:RNA polymerase sigma-70 factor (subfamily 1)
MESEAHPLKQSLVLLRRAREGDPGAANDLFQRYLGRVIFLVRARLREPLRDRLETMDLVQEALATACARLPQFDPKSSGAFYVWVREIVERKVKEAYKHESADKRDRAREVSLQERGSGEQEFGAWVPAVSSLHLGTFFDRRDAVARLEREIESLEAGQADAIRLWYFESLTPAEMAPRLQKSPDACRMLVARALKTLGRKMKGPEVTHAG